MAVTLNHTIVHSRQSQQAASWLAEVLGLDAPVRWGPFWEVRTANGVDLAFMDREDDEITAQHYAFLIAEDEFDQVLDRLAAQDVEHFADASGRKRGEINHNDGGRGMYFSSPDGHWMEVITRPYGSDV